MPEVRAVGQLVNRYLPITQNWLFEQIRHLGCFRAVVLARRTTHPERFPIDALYSFGDGAVWRHAWNVAVEAATGCPPDLVAAARTERIELLHAHFGHVAVRGVPLAARLGVPLIASFYGFDIGKDRRGRDGLRRTYARLFERGAAFLVEGPVAWERLVGLGCPEQRMILHRLGVDLERLGFRPRCREPGSPLRVLMAGRFTEKKGLEYGVEAVCGAVRSGLPLTATVVGDAGRDAAGRGIRRRLHGLVERSGAQEQVRFTGELQPTDLRRLLYQHHVFLQPSVEAADGDCEGGLPMSLVEAAASGMALIGTRHSDIPEIVRPGKTGWLCGERSASELESALREAYERTDLISDFGAHARRLIEQSYDIRRETLDQVYRRTLAA